MHTNPLLRIGTRESPLALAQTREVRERLGRLHPALATPEGMAEVGIKTKGDLFLDQPLAEIGGKGLFTKEIDEALRHGAIDIAVHSMKDVQTILPEGLVLAAILEREDPRDAFVSHRAPSLAELPGGAVVGTASLRRGAQVLHMRPDLKVVPLRGNVQTRLRKLAEGAVDAIVLAVAGLRRLGLAERITALMPVEEMLPAVAQGAIGVVCRANDNRAQDYLRHLDHAPTALCVGAERAFLAVLDGNCRTPIAGLAELTGDWTTVRFRGLVVGSGAVPFCIERRGPAARAVPLAREAGEVLLRQGALLPVRGD
ncbi:MAG: hydroxymethylbilane synthase [Rhodospirillaceae bacterium]|nr:MAG: hydroxymethylbilane synthase [Rhodospirillaceae bacterium]